MYGKVPKYADGSIGPDYNPHFSLVYMERPSTGYLPCEGCQKKIQL